MLMIGVEIRNRQMIVFWYLSKIPYEEEPEREHETFLYLLLDESHSFVVVDMKPRKLVAVSSSFDDASFHMDSADAACILLYLFHRMYYSHVQI